MRFFTLIPGRVKMSLYCLILSAISVTNASAQRYSAFCSPRNGFITDIVLIYQGGTHRPDWTAGRFEPYVYQVAGKGKTNFLFDTFLFIEYKDNMGNQFAEGYSLAPAKKEQWSWLLSQNFAKGRAVNALNHILDSLAERGIKPVRKRKVILTIPEPNMHQKNWGEIAGKSLDFDRDRDRIAASKWYIDEALKRWKAGNFGQLELAGFYWVSEQSASSRKILPEIAAYIKSKKLKFFWIPYWGSDGSTSWKESGFDMAFQQPNYFFNDKTPDSRVDSACAVAKRHGMGLEMEFDNRVEESDPLFERKFHLYLNRFKYNSALNDAPIAYYEGGDAIYRLAKQTNPAKKNLYNILCRTVVERQARADKCYNEAKKRTHAKK